MFINDPQRLIGDMTNVARQLRSAMGLFDNSKHTVDIIQNTLITDLFEHGALTDEQLVGPSSSPLMELTEKAARESADPEIERLQRLMTTGDSNEF